MSQIPRNNPYRHLCLRVAAEDLEGWYLKKKSAVCTTKMSKTIQWLHNVTLLHHVKPLYRIPGQNQDNQVDPLVTNWARDYEDSSEFQECHIPGKFYC